MGNWGYNPYKPISETNLGGGNSMIFYVHPYLGKWSNLTYVFP